MVIVLLLWRCTVTRARKKATRKPERFVQSIDSCMEGRLGPCTIGLSAFVCCLTCVERNEARERCERLLRRGFRGVKVKLKW